MEMEMEMKMLLAFSCRKINGIFQDFGTVIFGQTLAEGWPLIYPKSSSNRDCSRVLSSVTAVVWRSPSVYKYRVARWHSAVSHDQQCHQDSIMLHTPLHLPSGCGISPTQIVEYAQININIHKYLLYIHIHPQNECSFFI